MCERHNYAAPDHILTMLIDPQLDLSQSPEANRVQNICEALSHMSDLQVFSWCWNMAGQQQHSKATILPAHKDVILETVHQKPTLKHFGLLGRFTNHVQSSNIDCNSMSYPVSWLSLFCGDVADNTCSSGMYPSGCLGKAGKHHARYPHA